MKKISWRIVVVMAAIGAAWAFAYFEGGYLAYHIWDATQLLAGITLIQVLFPLQRVRIERHIRPDLATEGDSVTIELMIQANTWWPWAWVAVTDSLPATLHADHNPHFVVALWPKRTVTVRYQLAHVPRGIYTLKAPRIATGDVLGLWEKSRLATNDPMSMIIWPQTTALTHLGHVFQQWAGNTEMSRRISEDTSLLLGIRDYVSGDRLAQIHWRTTARTGQFKVKQFEPTTQPQIRIILDDMQAFQTEREWELAIQIAASLTDVAARYTQPLGFLWVGDGDQRIGIGTGRTHYETILNYLAALPRFHPNSHNSMTFIPDDAIPLWITMRGNHPALSDAVPVIRVGEELDQLEDLSFYLEHRLHRQAYGLSH
ncbi:DUF58 domain-containing protein [Sulfobacillus thermosulfidooxidans]|uniref:DUF58 domain-containing protein n=1 Tax=Sulfobacillus thermosulfidooxidans TaxID=28034 RepID=UPI00096BAE5C|nr:DUF58 domain-containing protein [Sulfobacillus thermosulfidooxidans]OLZ10983.1 hypothetical protein BFX05_09620 [Sulfobacillus thermosulfidooxidans]OLZ14471.1 hypothetical protein BFX06_09445 [Sulfobacillus thermosulfidooxidans]OLZ19214.1 hypothetical protein BFX07_05840 [Sulfobacillus thermosulfidooxidans]